MTSVRRMIACCTLLLASCQVADPTFAPHVYLTWADDDTSTSITVNYHTRDDFEGSEVHYDTASRHGNPAAYHHHESGDSPPRKLWRVRRYVHQVTLRGLQPDTTYYFVAGDVRGGFSAEKRFRTLPGGDHPLRFVEGADIGVGRAVPRFLRAAADLRPMFALIAGDLAYANGNLAKLWRWDKWLANWERHMVTPDGDSIPMVVAIGNHDVGKWRSPYLAFFAQRPDGRTYFSRRFGTQLVVIVLDSDHVAPHDGAQRQWLEATLRANRDVPLEVALYHVPLYPVHYPFDLESSGAGRRHWGPLFDALGLTLAFEAHDHCYKRTKRLRGGTVVDDGGVVFVGGGPWGGAPKAAQGDHSYVATVVPRRHFMLAEVADGRMHLEARGVSGEVLDAFTIAGRGPDEPTADPRPPAPRR